MKLDGVMELWRYLLVFCELTICLSSNRAAVLTSPLSLYILDILAALSYPSKKLSITEVEIIILLLTTYQLFV